MSSVRNRTLVITDYEREKYIARCLTPAEIVDLPLDKTICGDFFAAVERLPEGFADLVIADPPYNLAKDFHGNKFAAMGEENYRLYTERWLNAVLRLLKKNGSIYVCCDWRSGMVIGDVLASKLKILSRITWQREKGRGAARNWKNSLEDIWFAVNGEKYKFDVAAVKIKKRVIAPYKTDGKPRDWHEEDGEKYRLTCPSNFWNDISVPYWSMPENTAHPTQKPEKLMAKLILASSEKGDVVFDPFAGSGTTSVTAKKLGRHFIGVEMNPLYCAWAEKRLESAETDKRIQGFEDGVFLERNAKLRK